MKTAAKKSTRRPRRLRRRRVARRRRTNNVPEWASLSVKRSLETPTTPPQPGFQSNTLYSLMNTQLIDYPRAVAVAQAYQHYRIKSIKLTFKPTFDNYLAAAGAVSKPNLYYMIDKSGSLPSNITLEGLKNMGARPKQLDEKNMTITWKPSVLESVMYSGGGVGLSASSKYRISPWLTTTADNIAPGPSPASGIDHLGIYWYMDQLSNPVGAQYTIEVECQFEFKKPVITVLTTTTEAQKARVATINDSPDGVVGGGDGI